MVIRSILFLLVGLICAQAQFGGFWDLGMAKKHIPPYVIPVYYWFDFEETGTPVSPKPDNGTWSIIGAGEPPLPDVTTWAGRVGNESLFLQHITGVITNSGYSDTSEPLITNLWCAFKMSITNWVNGNTIVISFGQGTPGFEGMSFQVVRGGGNTTVRFFESSASATPADTFNTLDTTLFVLLRYVESGGDTDTLSVECNTTGTFDGSGTDFAEETDGSYLDGATRVTIGPRLSTGWGIHIDEVKIWTNDSALGYDPYTNPPL